ncbi:hypothetical protein AB7076_07815 [Providencia rettgeri]|nr:hypothetical protein [Providencia rettgeri]
MDKVLIGFLFFPLLFISVVSKAEVDTVKYDEKRKLDCILLSRNLMRIDSKAIGSQSAGWLRKVESISPYTGFSSIEIDGWVIRGGPPTSNTGETIDDGTVIIISEFAIDSSVALNRKTGDVSMGITLSDGSLLEMGWKCKIGVNLL